MRFAILAIVGAVWLVPHVADATCAPSQPEFSPQGGTLPPDPMILLFVPMPLSEGPGRIAADGAEITVSEVAHSPAFTVYKIVVKHAPGLFTVRYEFPRSDRYTPQPAIATYAIGRGAADTARVTDVKYVRDEWTCSHTDAVGFEIDGTAIGYRFDWHSGEAATIISPRYPALGFLSCIGRNVGVDLAEPHEFDLVAMFADGKEQRLGTASVMNDANEVRLPLELVGEDDVATVDKRGWVFNHGRAILQGLLALAAALLAGLWVPAFKHRHG